MDTKDSDRLLVGVDVGGTKILAATVKSGGEVVARSRRSTPRGKKPAAIVKAVVETILQAVEEAGAQVSDLEAVGIAVPGVVDPDAGRVIVTPNTNLSGVAMSDEIRTSIDVPVSLGNDVNLGTLGEKWLGSGRNASSIVGIFVGTGIGGGLFSDGRLQRGFGGGAGEIGHIIMQLDGPKCGCGNQGCFEALASRTAIERDIRAMIAGGRKSVVTDLLKGKSALLRSGILKQALSQGDEVVTEVLTRASEIIGRACRSVCHLIEPEAFVLGGGVIEACWDFMLPIVEGVVESDPFSGDRPGGRVLLSALGDDAVALGAVALALQRIGKDPFDASATSATRCAAIRPGKERGFVVGRDAYDHDIYVRADCEVGRPKKTAALIPADGGKGKIGPKVLEKVCEGSPETLFLPAGGGGLKLTRKGEAFLHFRGIEVRRVPSVDLIEAYNACHQRKAILLPSPGE
jgi:glucokinase